MLDSKDKNIKKNLLDKVHHFHILERCILILESTNPTPEVYDEKIKNLFLMKREELIDFYMKNKS